MATADLAPTSIHPVVAAVTARIVARSLVTRTAYMQRVATARNTGAARGRVSCTNLAHAFAAEAPNDKLILREIRQPNIGIVSAYNDMLSAHQPLARFLILKDSR